MNEKKWNGQKMWSLLSSLQLMFMNDTHRMIDFFFGVFTQFFSDKNFKSQNEGE